MSRTKTQKEKEAKPAEETKADTIPTHTMPLPTIIALKDSQRFALNALNNDVRQLSQQLAQLKENAARTMQAIEDTKIGRLSVLAEIEKENGLEQGIIDREYQFDTKQFVQANIKA
jgi:hypothetical protein